MSAENDDLDAYKRVKQEDVTPSEKRRLEGQHRRIRLEEAQDSSSDSKSTDQEETITHEDNKSSDQDKDKVAALEDDAYTDVEKESAGIENV